MTRSVSTGDYYTAIGKLVVEFEQAVECMRWLIMQLANLYNTNPDQRVARTFMHRMSARELGEVCRALFADVRLPDREKGPITPSARDIAVVDDIVRRWYKLCDSRNEALHSAWIILTTDKEVALAPCWKRSKAGTNFDARRYPLEHFIQVGEEARAIRELLMRLSGGFLLAVVAVQEGTNVEHLVATQFAIDSDGRASIPVRSGD